MKENKQMRSDFLRRIATGIVGTAGTAFAPRLWKRCLQLRQRSMEPFKTMHQFDGIWRNHQWLVQPVLSTEAVL